MTTLQKHIRCTQGDVAKYVLLPGDPARARRISEQFDHAELVAQNREFVVYTGATAGIPVSVCSTGIGSPSTAIAMEELTKIGASVFIRVGSAGGRQPDMPIGSLAVLTSAYRDEGTSLQYLPLGFPAVASLDVTNALVEATKEYGYGCRTGVGTSRDAFYIRDAALNETLREGGVIAAEMEASALFIIGAVRGVRTGCILATDSNIWLKTQPTLEKKEALYFEGEKKIIQVALRAVQLLAMEE